MSQFDFSEHGEFFPLIEEPIPRPAGTALLIVDMTKGQAHPEFGLGALARARGLDDSFRGYYGRISRCLPNILRLREVVGALGGEIVHIRTTTQSSQMTEVAPLHKTVGHCLGVCPVDSTEAEFLGELHPSDREIVIDKTCISPFNCSPLDRILRNMGIDVLIVTGVRTNDAVELTAHGAGDRGYWVFLVSDACAALTEELHEATLRALNFGLVKVKTTKDVLAMLLHKDWKRCS